MGQPASCAIAFTSSGWFLLSHHRNRMLLGFMWVDDHVETPFRLLDAARRHAGYSPDGPGRRTSIRRLHRAMRLSAKLSRSPVIL